MDISLLYVHGKDAPGHQRGINIDSWVADLFPFDARKASQRTIRVRDVDTGQIREFRAPIGKLKKNVRLHGDMIRGENYKRYVVNDLVLLKVSPQPKHKITLAFFNRSKADRKLFKALTDPANTRWRYHIGIVSEERQPAVEEMLSGRDPELFLQDEVEQMEAGESPKPVRGRMSRATFERIQRLCIENGIAGEKFVLAQERKHLIDAGYKELAGLVQHVAFDEPTSPFDILSFNKPGKRPTEKYIEVKATSGDRMSFEMSAQEWEFARQKGDQHHVHRVTQVKSTSPKVLVITNVAGAGQAKRITRVPTSYRVTYRSKPDLPRA